MNKEIDFISEIKIKSYVFLFEQYVAIRRQIETTTQVEYVVKLTRSLEDKKAELAKAFDAIAERIGNEHALELIKAGVEKFGGYDQLKE